MKTRYEVGPTFRLLVCLTVIAMIIGGCESKENTSNELTWPNAARIEYIGKLYHSEGNLAEAEKHYKESLEIFTNMGINNGIANQYKNLTFVYFEQGNRLKACKIALLSVSFYKLAGNNEMEAEAEDWIRKNCNFP